MGKLLAFVRGACIGAACMYLFDPNAGRRRRALIKDKAVKAANDVEAFVESGVKDLRNRATGIAAEARAIASGDTSHVERLSSRARNLSGAMESNWAPGPRLLACITGGLLCLRGLGRGGVRGLIMLCCGGALTARAATNKTVEQMRDTIVNGQSGDQQQPDAVQPVRRRASVKKAA